MTFFFAFDSLTPIRPRSARSVFYHFIIFCCALYHVRFFTYKINASPVRCPTDDGLSYGLVDNLARDETFRIHCGRALKKHRHLASLVNVASLLPEVLMGLTAHQQHGTADKEQVAIVGHVMCPPS